MVAVELEKNVDRFAMVMLCWKGHATTRVGFTTNGVDKIENILCKTTRTMIVGLLLRLLVRIIIYTLYIGVSSFAPHTSSYNNEVSNKKKNHLIIIFFYYFNTTAL